MSGLDDWSVNFDATVWVPHFMEFNIQVRVAERFGCVKLAKAITGSSKSRSALKMVP
jgi:hypothetical protein